MTIEMKLLCDGSGCNDSVEIEGDYDHDVEIEGYTTHPLDGVQHYCRTCWPKVKHEIEEE